MNSSRSHAPTGQRQAGAKALTFTLILLLTLPPATLASPRAAAPPPLKHGARAASSTRPAQAGGLLFEVNTTGDGSRVVGGASCDADASTPGDQCTLRSAIEAANANAGEDGIDIVIPASAPGCDAATGRCTIILTTDLPILTDGVSIVGPGPDKLTVRSNGGRIFHIGEGMVAWALSGMTITGSGHENGAVNNRLNSGTLNVTNCSITGNVLGGISNELGTLNITNSTISDNTAGYAAGIYNSDEGTVNMTGSVVNGNIATGVEISGNQGFGHGGGISNFGTLNITNSTISGNIAGHGGGIYNAGIVNLTNSTVSYNVAHGPGSLGTGGGIHNDNGYVANVRSSVIALNRQSDVAGSFTSHGFNLIGRADPSNGFTQPTDQTGTPGSPLDPKLDPGGLKDNGGPTHTIALLPTSPAIDKGTSAGLTGALSTDQRGGGFPRTVDDSSIANAGDGADVGAFEARPVSVLQFSSAAYSVGEATASATITVKRTGNLGQAVTVNYTTADGTAVAGKDYTSACSALSFAPNQTAKTFTVAVFNDKLDEANETINLALSNPTGGATLGAPNTAVLTITDEDPTPTLSINNASVTEGNSGSVNATFTVSLSAASGKTVTVNYATANGTATAPADYAARTGKLSFLPGQTTKPVAVAVRGDLLNEANETFFVNLTSPVNATLADGQGLGTITNNDPLPSLTISDVNITEIDSGTNNVTLVVKLSAASGQNVSVNYATANGTASSATDYTAESGTVTFTPGLTTRTIVIAVKGDLLREANETFFVNLGGAVNATIADTQGRVTILNDD